MSARDPSKRALDIAEGVLANLRNFTRDVALASIAMAEHRLAECTPSDRVCDAQRRLAKAREEFSA